MGNQKNETGKWNGKLKMDGIIYFLDLLFACDAVFHLFSVVIIDKYTSVFFFKRKNMQFENLSQFLQVAKF